MWNYDSLYTRNVHVFVLYNLRKSTKRLLVYVSLLIIFSCGGQLTEEEKKEFEAANKNVEIEVSDWIKNHAQYPNSYKSVSYSEFSQSVAKRNDEKIPGSEKYVIKHSHNILDKDSNLVTFSGYFILENEFDVNIIELERSNLMGGAFPPQTEIWTEQFGRSLNTQDSLDFLMKKQRVKDKLYKEFIDKLE